MMQEFVEAVKNTVKKELTGIHTAVPGRIISYNSDTGLATVLPIMKYRLPNGTSIDYPKVTDVPVLFPRTKTASIAVPVNQGDGCLLIFAENTTDYWLYGQETATSLPFDLSNAICIPGLYSSANAAMKQACEEQAIVIDNGGVKAIVKQDAIKLVAPEVTIDGNLVVTGTVSSNS